MSLSGGVQRVFFQVLLASEGRMVSTEALVDELWGESPPGGVVNALHAQVSRLRKRLGVLEPWRETSRLTKNANGYQLVMAEEELDAALFVRSVRTAQTMVYSDPAAASETLRAALLMWQGPVFGGGSGGILCQAAARRYEEYRIGALEAYFESRLALGNHVEILGELSETHAENPLRERFCEQLMIALYRAGRQAEALQTYRWMRSRLTRELGIEPSPVLRRTEQAILRHDAQALAGRCHGPLSPEVRHRHAS
ncbi:BTAD domain-containing putative transcriptional regulator [Streptomyces sp. NPDC059454]|uniref:AfsR/SARP family transcriptional regulator n=1 Tax=Streptomyces sp. NPDC059454 TaxID=3346836 RepID=UPI0036CFEE05